MKRSVRDSFGRLAAVGLFGPAIFDQSVSSKRFQDLYFESTGHT